MKYPSMLSITAQVACIFNICRETNPKTTYRGFSCYQSYIHFSFWCIWELNKVVRRVPVRCVQDEMRKKLERSQYLAGRTASSCVPGAPLVLLSQWFFFLSRIPKLCDYITVPAHWMLVKMKCVNHKKHSEQYLVHPVILNVLLFLLVLIYLIQSKVAIAFHVLKTQKMNIY